jgi:tetratricopeptide (TPR) repeat protein
VALLQGAHREAQEYCQEALEVSIRADSRTGAAYSLVFLGHTARERGDHARATHCYQESLALFEEVGVIRAVGRLHQHLGDVALAIGDYSEAREHHLSALARYLDLGTYWVAEDSTIGGCWGVPVSMQTLGNIALTLGSSREAIAHYRQALEMAMERPYVELRLHVLLGPARLLAEEGTVARAMEVVALVLHHSASAGETREKARALLDELQPRLSPDTFAAAVERGQSRDLEAALDELLTDLGG